MAGISKVVSVITLAEPQSRILNCGVVICTIVCIPTCPQNKPPQNNTSTKSKPQNWLFHCSTYYQPMTPPPNSFSGPALHFHSTLLLESTYVSLILEISLSEGSFCIVVFSIEEISVFLECCGSCLSFLSTCWTWINFWFWVESC